MKHSEAKRVTPIMQMSANGIITTVEAMASTWSTTIDAIQAGMVLKEMYGCQPFLHFAERHGVMVYRVMFVGENGSRYYFKRK